MKIRLVSDLHLEFAPFDIPEMEGDDETILLLAGDIGTETVRVDIEALLAQASAQFKEVIYIPGNHEYYHGFFPVTWEHLKERLKGFYFPNVHFLDQECIVLNDAPESSMGLMIVGATLWSELTDVDAVMAKNMMNDYQLVTSSTTGFVLRPAETTAVHRQSAEYIFGMAEVASQHQMRVVVVTHHAPSPQSVHDRYDKDPINPAYYTDLEDRIVRAGNIDLWVHGHMHTSFDYKVGDTRVVANPRGYRDENPDFDPRLVIEV